MVVRAGATSEDGARKAAASARRADAGRYGARSAVAGDRIAVRIGRLHGNQEPAARPDGAGTYNCDQVLTERAHPGRLDRDAAGIRRLRLEDIGSIVAGDRSVE